jgi:hypothetical protein
VKNDWEKPAKVLHLLEDVQEKLFTFIVDAVADEPIM